MAMRPYLRNGRYPSAHCKKYMGWLTSGRQGPFPYLFHPQRQVQDPFGHATGTNLEAIISRTCSVSLSVSFGFMPWVLIGG